MTQYAYTKNELFKEKLHACSAIIESKSVVFDRLLYNGSKESYEKQISFPEINSSEMKFILKYVYIGPIIEESLTVAYGRIWFPR